MTPLLALGLVLVQAPRADSLGLTEAVAYARAHRGTIVAAAAAVDEAHGALSDRRGLPNPIVSYTKTDDTPHRAATLQQSFDWLLSRGSSVGAARARATRAEVDLESARRDLQFEVHEAYVRALATTSARRLAEAQFTVADTLTKVAERRLSAGDIPEAEAERLRLERILALQTLSRARAEEGSAISLLARDLGWPPDSALPPLSGSLADGLDRPPPSAPALAALPSVRGALADSSAAAAEASSAGRARLPLPTLEVGRLWDDPALPGSVLWSFGASIPVPLFNRGGGAASAARARARIAAADLQEARLAARQRVEQGSLQLGEARLRARLANDSLLPGAARLRSRAARAYALGETGILPLLEALRAEREIVASALDDLLAYQEALAEWNALSADPE